jgi:DNA-directed RNA polymerase subunit RPC12/RpoP
MKCGRCSGRVLIDRVFSQKLHMEVYCLNCGKRWMLDKEKSKIGRWLATREEAYLKELGISL